MRPAAIASRCVAFDVSPHVPERAGSAARWFASHELRTPLQAIRGGVELLLAERGTGLSALQVEALGLIAGATADLEQAIDMLAELAAVEMQPPAADGLRDGALAPHELGSWLADPAIARHLRPTDRVLEVAWIRVRVAPPVIARALPYLKAASAPVGPDEPLVCDLVAIEADACVLDLSLPDVVSGNGAIARRLATTLLAQGGAGLRAHGRARVLLTLRRAT